MAFSKRVLFWMKAHPLRTIITIVAAVALVQFLGREVAVETAVVAELPVVEVKAVDALTNTSLFSTVGAVEAVSEAQLKVENGGQVTAVYTELGKFVTAGTIIAQLENSRERASLLQAQGSYDAAVAGAAQSNSSVDGAKIAVSTAITGLETTLRNGQTTITSIVTGTVDQFFANPTSYFPGLRVRANTDFLNRERISLQKELPALQTAVSARITSSASAPDESVIAASQKVIAMIDELLVAVERDGDDDLLAGQPLSTYATGLYTAKSNLQSLIASIETGVQALASAEENLNRTELSGTDANLSLANAQIKVALGSLRAAQAAYEKTLVRTPISGVINALTIKRGDYVTPLQDVALVANNKGLQVTTGINESDRDRLTVGDEVQIESVATGTIIAIGGAVDPKTGKVAVKVSLPDDAPFSNGTNVTLNFGNASSTAKTQDIFIPLSAVKLGADGAAVFTVSADKKLEAKPVTLGIVLGDKVAIKDGITGSTEIVLDARGLKAGEAVEVKSN